MKHDVVSYKVIILGDEYTIVSDEPEEHIIKAANYTHALMQEIIQKAPYALPKTIAVLAALRLASKVINAEEKAKKRDERNAQVANLIERELIGTSSGWEK